MVVLCLKSPLAKKNPPQKKQRKTPSNHNPLCLWPTPAQIHSPLDNTSLVLRHLHGVFKAAHLGSGCLTCRDGGPHSQQRWRCHPDCFFGQFLTTFACLAAPSGVRGSDIFSFSASLSDSIDARQKRACGQNWRACIRTFMHAHTAHSHNETIPAHTLWHLMFYLLFTVIMTMHSILCKGKFLSFLKNDFTC